MISPGRMLHLALSCLFKKPATTDYPFKKAVMPENFRGRIVFHPELCIGCKMCERDCPANAIHIKKIADKQFEAEFDLGRCIYCAQCVYSCMKKALESSKDFELAQLNRVKLKVTIHAEPKEPGPAA